MPRLCFLRKNVGIKVIVLGVKHVEDAIFYMFGEKNQDLGRHPIRVRNLLEQCKSTRTSPITICDDDYEKYVQDGKFYFRGTWLEKGI